MWNYELFFDFSNIYHLFCILDVKEKLLTIKFTQTQNKPQKLEVMN